MDVALAKQSADSLALLSDVHGNHLALEAVLADLEARGVRRIYCLGDLVGYGPAPEQVVSRIRKSGITTILGNYDEGIAWEKGDCGCYYPDQEAKRVGALSYAFTAAAVSAQSKAYLRSLPRELHVTLAGKKVHLVHGSPRRINEYLLADREERTFLRLAEKEPDDVLAFGHTHVPWHHYYGKVLFVNAGSVGRPRDGDPRAAYVLLHSSAGSSLEVEVRRVVYDVETVVEETLKAGLPARLADELRQARRV